MQHSGQSGGLERNPNILNVRPQAHGDANGLKTPAYVRNAEPTTSWSTSWFKGHSDALDTYTDTKNVVIN